MMRRCSITSSFLFVVSPTRALYPLAFRRGHHPYLKIGCAGRDLNPRPLAYEASELPDCSTAQFWREGTDLNRRLSFVQCRVATARHVSLERSNRLSYPLVVFSSAFCQRTVILSHTSSGKSMAKNTPCRLWSAGRSAVAE